jgi:hypothetical protein
MEVEVAEDQPIHTPFYVVKAKDRDRGKEVFRGKVKKSIDDKGQMICRMAESATNWLPNSPNNPMAFPPQPFPFW